MQTQVNTLYEFAKSRYSLAFHSGEKGMRNSVSWIYLTEDIHNTGFLKGGEMIITTGLFTNSGVSLLDFIRAFAMKNCSCILLNIGNYLKEDDITEEILNFCEINKVPLFTMPWEVHLVEIMQDYCRLLLQDNLLNDNLSAAFQSCLYQPSVPDNILLTLNQFGFPTAAAYRIMAIRNLHDTTMVTSPLNSYRIRYHLFDYDNMKILIWLTEPDEVSLEKLIKIICYCDGVMLGVSDTMHSISDIGNHFKRARFSLAVSELWGIPSTVFDELGIFQILFSSSDPALLHSLYKRNLGILEQYDQQNDTEFVKTLRIYLASDCNLIETASRLFMHRNTIVYRIRKIKDILGSELDNSSVKFNLLMAFYIKDYLSM